VIRFMITGCVDDDTRNVDLDSRFWNPVWRHGLCHYGVTPSCPYGISNSAATRPEKLCELLCTGCHNPGRHSYHASSNSARSPGRLTAAAVRPNKHSFYYRCSSCSHLYFISLVRPQPSLIHMIRFTRS
jgi:hypothetical protein